MRNRKSLFGGILGGALLTLAVAATVFGYAGQVAATVVVTGPSGAQSCGTPLTLTATVRTIEGTLIAGQPVTWSFDSGNLSGDKILDTTTTTNSKGVATTRVQLSCSSHSVRFLVTADDAQGTVTVRTTGEGLPRTDIAPSSDTTPLPLVLLAGLAVLVGSGTILRRFATDRR